MFFMNHNAFSENYNVNPAIDKDFIARSNGIPQEEAEIQLKDFLTSLGSWEEVKKWLISKGFRITMKSRLLTKYERKKYTNQDPVFSNVSWDNKKLGIIFVDGWLGRQVSKILVHGVGVGIEYAVENGQFIVYDVNVTHTME